ncbi:MAG: hypothetical protein SFT92_01035 [Rickettsiales bacterium]|nr:hypothetical protein [Rickettsiales bacterium]
MIRILLAAAVLFGVYWVWSYFSPPAPAVLPPVSVESAPRELSQQEKEYYVRIFDYTMDYVQGGQSYAWQTHGGKGDIAVEEPFTSKSKTLCRKYKEQLIIANKQTTIAGIACKRQGRDGWCRLKEDNALTCAMEKPNYLGTVGVQTPTTSTPNINLPAGGVGRVGAPSKGASSGSSGPRAPGEVDAPDGETYADTVTGTAGAAAGPATSGAFKWFNDTFR